MDAVYDKEGREMPDQTPIELPLGYQHPESLQDMIRRMVTDAAFVAAREAEGLDNEEEANDFDVMDEEPLAPSNYEYSEMQEETINDARRREKQAKDAADLSNNPEGKIKPEADDSGKDKKADPALKPSGEEK